MLLLSQLLRLYHATHRTSDSLQNMSFVESVQAVVFAFQILTQWVVYAPVADNVPRLLLSLLLDVNQRVINARIGFSGPRSAYVVSSRTHWPHAISRSSGSAPAYTA